MYAEKNKLLQRDIIQLQDELKTAKDMLKNVEKYWTQQALLEKKSVENDQTNDPTKSSYAIQLLRENENLKEKLNQLETKAPMCFHGKCIPPNAPVSYQGCIDFTNIRDPESWSNITGQFGMLFLIISF